MCRFEKLHHTEQGYVVRCNECRHIHVAFGTTVLAFTGDAYRDFARTIREQHRLYKDVYDVDQKIIQVPTDARSVTLVYTPAELKQLHQLLRRATALIDREGLFCFNDN